MDRRTQLELQHLGATMPKWIKDNLLLKGKFDPLDNLQLERMEAAIRKAPDSKTREMLRKTYEYTLNDIKNRSERNLEAEAEAEKFIETKVRKLISSGRIPKPDLKEYKKFMAGLKGRI